MKVMHILTDSNIGGAGRLLYNISSCIDRKKYDFIFVFSNKSKLVDLFKPLGFKILTIKSGADQSFNIVSIFEILTLINKEMPDIVHTHSSLSGRIAASMCNKPNKKIYTKHCVFGVPNIMKYRIAKKARGVIDNLLTDKIVAVAEAARNELISGGIDSSKINVIINGSGKLKVISEDKKKKIREALGIKNGEVVVGISARLEECKGHKYLLEAARISRKNGKKFKFIIMGNGSYETKLKQMTKNMGIEKSVIFLGFVNDVAPYMNIFDINVNCSIGTETSSLAISEGLSLGIPAIVSDYGGNPCMVKNGVTGFVVKQADPDALYRALNKLASDKELYERMSKNAKKDFVCRFSDTIMAKKYEDLYKEMTSN